MSKLTSLVPFNLSANRVEAPAEVLVFAYGDTKARTGELPVSASVAVLQGFRRVFRCNCVSIVEDPNNTVMGTLCKVTKEELARLDTYADLKGLDVHRFGVMVTAFEQSMPLKRWAWVYQLVSDADGYTKDISANPSLFS